MRRLMLMVALLAGCATSKSAPEPPPVEAPAEPETEPTTTAIDLMSAGREATEMFYAGETKALHARFSEEMVAALPGEAWSIVQSKTLEQLGPEIELVEESTSQVLRNRMYHRTVLFEKAPKMKLVMTWGFYDDGTITGFNLKPHREPAASEHLEYSTKTPLQLPFEGEWAVIWGGRTVHQNYHAVDGNQRFALDLLIVGEDDLSYQGDRSANENFLAFGKEVVAPGAGKIIKVKDGVEDNVPGQMNPEEIAGNFVIIDHGNGEYSFLAHFKNGSIAVSEGDEVAQGQLLGLCGNSGNSSEPHIHYHLQDSPAPLEGAGLPIQFSSALIDGERQDHVEVLQGQRVRPR